MTALSLIPNTGGSFRRAVEAWTENKLLYFCCVESVDPDTVFSKSLVSPLLDTSLEELRERGFVRTNRPEVAYEGLQFDHMELINQWIEKDKILQSPKGYGIKKGIGDLHSRSCRFILSLIDAGGLAISSIWGISPFSTY